MDRSCGTSAPCPTTTDGPRAQRTSSSAGGTMSRPRSQAEYLARLVPPSVAGLRRRSLITGAAGTGALLGTGLLAGCGDSESDSGGSGSKNVSLGSNQSDPKPKDVVAKVA